MRPSPLFPSPPASLCLAVSGWRSAIVAALAVTALAAFSLVIFTVPAGSDLLTVLDDLGMMAVLAVAAGLALNASRSQKGLRARWSWLLIGVGLLCWLVGDSYWAWTELVLGMQPSTPSLADVAYMCQVPCMLAGILIRPVGRPRDIRRGLLALDVAIILSALTAVTWTVALGPLFGPLGTAPLAQGLSVSYPLADLAIVFFLIAILVRSTENRLATRLLTLSAGLVAIADATYTLLSAEATYRTGHWIDLLWFAGVALVAVAAVTDAPREAKLPSGPNIGRAWQFVMPAILVSVAGSIVWIYPLATEGHWPSTEQMVLALALGLLTLRMALSYRDAVLVHTLFVQRARDHEAARAATEEAARLQGVILTGRELAHLLNNDLAISLGAVELLGAQSDLPPDLRALVGDASNGLDRAIEHVRQLQQVSRVATKQTPLGPALDLRASLQQTSS
jgi:hypothetical protein